MEARRLRLFEQRCSVWCRLRYLEERLGEYYPTPRYSRAVLEIAYFRAVLEEINKELRSKNLNATEGE